MGKFKLDDAYERLKKVLDELRHLTQRLNETVARHDDHFAAEMGKALAENRR